MVYRHQHKLQIHSLYSISSIAPLPYMKRAQKWIICHNNRAGSINKNFRHSQRALIDRKKKNCNNFQLNLFHPCALLKLLSFSFPSQKHLIRLMKLKWSPVPLQMMWRRNLIFFFFFCFCCYFMKHVWNYWKVVFYTKRFNFHLRHE